MKTISILFLFFLALEAHGATKEGKAPSKETLVRRIEAACEERVGEDFPEPQAICACVGRNLSAKVSLEELHLLARSHEENPEAEKELQKDSRSALVKFDYEVTETCLENPDWNAK